MAKNKWTKKELACIKHSLDWGVGHLARMELHRGEYGTTKTFYEMSRQLRAALGLELCIERIAQLRYEQIMNVKGNQKTIDHAIESGQTGVAEAFVGFQLVYQGKVQWYDKLIKKLEVNGLPPGMLDVGDMWK